MKKVLITLLSLCFILPLSAESITFRADSMRGTAGNTNNHTILTGKANVSTSSMTINADSIDMYGTDYRYILAEGNVVGNNTESKLNFTCGKLLFDRTTQIVTLEIGVHLIDEENNVTADAELIEYNQDTQIAIMQINVTLIQKDNLCTSSYAIYQKEKQTLDMSGNPQVTQGTDKFKAQEISLNLSTQEITLDGRVRGSVTSDKSKDKPEESTEQDIAKNNPSEVNQEYLDQQGEPKNE